MNLEKLKSKPNFFKVLINSTEEEIVKFYINGRGQCKCFKSTFFITILSYPPHYETIPLYTKI